MRLPSWRKSSRNLLRLLSRKHVGCTCGLLIFIVTNILWFSLVVPSRGTHHTSPAPSTDIVDFCMLDTAPCHPDIDRSLDRYFRQARVRYPTLLTYHPKVDCEHGRYLLLSETLASRVYHGTGSLLMWYLGVLNVAYKLNLTLVHLEWTAEHADDEKNSDREKYWQFYDWELPHAAYLSCPVNSSVRRNLLPYSLIPNQTFDQHHTGKQPFTVKAHLTATLERFLSGLKDDRAGFTMYSSQTKTITSSLMEMGMVFEIRWWLQHRKRFAEPHGVWSGVPLSLKAVTNQNTLLIGVHVRQGDVVKRDAQGRIISGDLYRYIAHSAYAPLLTFLLNALPAAVQQRYLITIYSEGAPADFDDILAELRSSVPTVRGRMAFFLNGRTSETFNRMVRDDVLLTAHSTFSMAVGIFNSRQLKIGPPHNQARVHGMRNFVSVPLNLNHTRYQLTERKKQLIRRRLEHVWKEKQRQARTATPLWLTNYADDYPEEFMLI